MINPTMMGQQDQPAPSAGPVDPHSLHVLMDLMPFKGLDTFRSPLQMQANYLTDMQFMELDLLLSAISTSPGRTDKFTGFTTALGLDVFYPNLVAQAYSILVDANGFHQIDYIGATSPVAITLPSGATWSTTAQTYMATLNGAMLFCDGISTPLVLRDGWNPASPALAFAGIAAPTTEVTAAAGTTGNLNGSYLWTVTFQNSGTFGPESAPSPLGQGAIVATPLAVTNQYVSLSNIPVSTDPQVNARNIYRIGGSIPEWRLVGTINDNVTTTAIDNVGDLNLGQLLVPNRDLPPAGMTVIKSHKSRLFGFVGNNLYFTLFNEPESWPSEYTMPVGATDPIITIASMGNSLLLIFKKNETWALFGQSLSDFVLQKVFDVGCIGPRAVYAGVNEAVWLATDGIRGAMIASGQIVNRLLGMPIWKTIRDIPAAAKQTAVFTYGNARYVLSFPDASISLSSGATPGPVSFVFDTKVGDWERERNPIESLWGYPKFGEWEKYPIAARQMIPLFAAGDPGFFFFSEYTTSPTFNLRSWPASTFTDLGGNVSWYFERKQFSGGVGKQVNRYRELEIIGPAQNGIIVTVTLTVDDDTVNKYYSTTVPLDNAPVRVGLPQNMVGRYITVNVSGSHSQQVIIDGVRVWGWIEHPYARDKS